MLKSIKNFFSSVRKNYHLNMQLRYVAPFVDQMMKDEEDDIYSTEWWKLYRLCQTIYNSKTFLDKQAYLKELDVWTTELIILQNNQKESV